MNFNLGRRIVLCGVAVLSIGTALLCWHGLMRFIRPDVSPYPTFYLALVYSASLDGRDPGLLATTVSVLLAGSFGLPRNGLATPNPVEVLSSSRLRGGVPG